VDLQLFLQSKTHCNTTTDLLNFLALLDIFYKLNCLKMHIVNMNTWPGVCHYALMICSPAAYNSIQMYFYESLAVLPGSEPGGQSGRTTFPPGTKRSLFHQLVNTSLQSSTFPSSQRHALVTLVLRTQHLDPTICNNYRPISNLSFVSKLLEHVVAK